MIGLSLRKEICGQEAVLCALQRNSVCVCLGERKEFLLQYLFIVCIQIFDKVKAESPDAIKKLVPLEGDLALEYLGLSKNDKQILIEEVSVVIHMAATLRLEAALKDSIIQNTLGTKRVMELCQKMKKLEVSHSYGFQSNYCLKSRHILPRFN